MQFFALASQFDKDQKSELPKINVRCGFEAEFASSIPREQVADELKKLLGVSNISVSNKYGASHGSDYDKWSVEDDSSIPTSPGFRTKVEVVSPILDLDTMVSSMHKVLFLIGGAGKTSNDTGIHLTFSLADFPQESNPVDPLKLALLLGEHYWATIFGRENASYAEEITKKLAFHVASYVRDGSLFKPADISEFIHNNTGRFAELHKTLLDSLPRYVSVNMEHSQKPGAKGRIEFRLLGGEGYENKADKVAAVARKFAYAMFASRVGSKLYDDVYAKKLWSFVEATQGKDVHNTTTKFYVLPRPNGYFAVMGMDREKSVNPIEFFLYSVSKGKISKIRFRKEVFYSVDLHASKILELSTSPDRAPKGMPPTSKDDLAVLFYANRIYLGTERRPSDCLFLLQNEIVPKNALNTLDKFVAFSRICDNHPLGDLARVGFFLSSVIPATREWPYGTFNDMADFYKSNVLPEYYKMVKSLPAFSKSYANREDFIGISELQCLFDPNNGVPDDVRTDVLIERLAELRSIVEFGGVTSIASPRFTNSIARSQAAFCASIGNKDLAIRMGLAGLAFDTQSWDKYRVPSDVTTSDFADLHLDTETDLDINDQTLYTMIKQAGSARDTFFYALLKYGPVESIKELIRAIVVDRKERGDLIFRATPVTTSTGVVLQMLPKTGLPAIDVAFQSIYDSDTAKLSASLTHESIIEELNWPMTSRDITNKSIAAMQKATVADFMEAEKKCIGFSLGSNALTWLKSNVLPDTNIPVFWEYADTSAKFYSDVIEGSQRSRAATSQLNAKLFGRGYKEFFVAMYKAFPYYKNNLTATGKAGDLFLDLIFTILGENACPVDDVLPVESYAWVSHLKLLNKCDLDLRGVNRAVRYAHDTSGPVTNKTLAYMWQISLKSKSTDEGDIEHYNYEGEHMFEPTLWAQIMAGSLKPDATVAKEFREEAKRKKASAATRYAHLKTYTVSGSTRKPPKLWTDTFTQVRHLASSDFVVASTFADAFSYQSAAGRQFYRDSDAVNMDRAIYVVQLLALAETDPAVTASDITLPVSMETLEPLLEAMPGVIPDRFVPLLHMQRIAYVIYRPKLVPVLLASNAVSLIAGSALSTDSILGYTKKNKADRLVIALAAFTSPQATTGVSVESFIRTLFYSYKDHGVPLDLVYGTQAATALVAIVKNKTMNGTKTLFSKLSETPADQWLPEVPQNYPLVDLILKKIGEQGLEQALAHAGKSLNDTVYHWRDIVG